MSLFRFSTKNPYFFRPLSDKFYDHESFKPRKIWAIYRHGTRFPGKKVISKYLSLAEFRDELIIKSKFLSELEIEAFKNWLPFRVSLDQQKFLTKQGEEELFELGKRFKAHFPTFFDEKSSTTFTFKHTPTQRTNLSAKRFSEGLFNETSINNYIIEEVSRDDPILRPYKGCPLWKKSVKKNPATYEVKNNFLKTHHVENMMNELREATQVEFLDFKDVELIYTMCGYETAWQHQLHNGKSIWCSLFKNENHIKIMEYVEDLDYYYIDGPGFEITRKVACRTVNDLINFLEPADKSQKLSFYFTHSGTILKLLTFLELYRDDVHLGGEEVNHDRNWKTSHIDSFATNIIAVLYDSNQGPQMQLIHQEKIVTLPIKSNEFGMFSFNEFKNFYDKKIQDCHLKSICEVKDEL